MFGVKARCALYSLLKPEVIFSGECSLECSHRHPRTALVHFYDLVNDLIYCVGPEIYCASSGTGWCTAAQFPLGPIVSCRTDGQFLYVPPVCGRSVETLFLILQMWQYYWEGVWYAIVSSVLPCRILLSSSIRPLLWSTVVKHEKGVDVGLHVRVILVFRILIRHSVVIDQFCRR